MGGVTAIAFVLDVVAPFTECFLEGVGKSLVLRVVLYSVPGDGMPSASGIGHILLNGTLHRPGARLPIFSVWPSHGPYGR